MDVVDVVLQDEQIRLVMGGLDIASLVEVGAIMLMNEITRHLWIAGYDKSMQIWQAI